MKKKSIGLIIGLMGCALLGVMAMQLYFLVQTYNMQSQLFDGQVTDALKIVVDKVAKEDANKFYKKKARYIDSQNRADNIEAGFTYDKDGLPGKKLHFVNRKVIIRDSLKRLRRALADDLAESGLGSVTLRIRFEAYTDESGIVHQRRINEVVKNPSSFLSPGRLHRFDTLRYNYLDPQFGLQVLSHVQENPIWKAEQERKQKTRQLRVVNKLLEQDSIDALKTASNKAVFADISEEYQKSKEPLSNRLDPLLIDSLLRFELQNKGISLPFSYEVSTANNDSVLYSKANDVTGERPVFTVASKPYQTPIFAKSVINDPGMLRLVFPKKSSLILSNMAFSMGTSGGLLLVLIFCFGYTIFSILRQKKISEMKTDFINNMTHEFKTPVSTIMIASEALKDDEVLQIGGASPAWPILFTRKTPAWAVILNGC
jgi:two-component system phosphate regulon sensor histidine kinase PhoR